MSRLTDLIIVGGGAAGLACAVTAARRGLNVLILERLDRVGKKLLATGNGRCNLMNVSSPRYPGGGAFADQVLRQCGVEEQKAFWAALGLTLREEDGGRVYPSSGQASTVLDSLRLALTLHHVQVETGVHVTAVEQTKHGFIVESQERQYRARYVLIAGGGKAQPKLGSDGSAMELLRALGHRIHPCKPALTQIQTDTKPIAGLTGIRVKADVSVMQGEKKLYQERGEVLFADYGVSGVCMMQCARYAQQKGATLAINFLHGMGFADADAAFSELERRRCEWKALPMEQLLTGLCVPRLSSSLCKAAGIVWKDRVISSLKQNEIRVLVQEMQHFTLRVQGVKGFEQAQVTSGGADPTQFDSTTMESRLVPGLYAAGEVLDVDGDCGGYNLMFAFACGLIAGNHMEVTRDNY